MKELAGVTSTKEYADFQRIRDHAPALLEALETSHKRLSQLIPDGYSDDDLCLFGQIESAIAAARGE